MTQQYPLIGIYPEETKIENDTCTPVFFAALFTIARVWKQIRCPLTDECIKNIWYICTMKYYSAIKRNAFESVLMRQMNLESIIQKEKDKYHTLKHIYGIQKDGTKEFICRAAMEKHRRQTYGHRKRRGDGEMYGESNMETYITICKIDSQQESAVCLREHKRDLYQPRWVGWGGRGEGVSRGKGNMYTYG